MKILYIHQYFTTPDSSGGTRSFYIAKEMLRQGHSVTMLTSDPTGKSESLVSQENCEGIEVVRIRNQYNNTMSAARRIVSFLTFMVMSTAVSVRVKKVDLVFATSTPLTVGIPALANKLLRRRDYVFEVRDLWPEFPIQMGAIKSRVLIKALQYFERTIYKHATLIVALSPGMKGPIDELGYSSKTVMIPNMAKPKEFYPRTSNAQVLRDFKIDPTAVKIVYFGTMGHANNIPHLVDEVMYAAENKLPVQVILIGDGALRAQAEADLAETSENYFRFLGKLNMENVSAVVNECQISVTSFLDLPILETNSPNKFFDSLSAGKPSAVNVNGWIKDIVEQHESGFYVDPTVRGDLVNKSLELLQDTTRYEKYCANARTLSVEQYDRDMLAKKVVDATVAAVG